MTQLDMELRNRQACAPVFVVQNPVDRWGPGASSLDVMRDGAAA